jgi:hypothetical protein
MKFHAKKIPIYYCYVNLTSVFEIIAASTQKVRMK